MFEAQQTHTHTMGCADDIKNDPNCEWTRHAKTCKAMHGASRCRNKIEDDGKTLRLGWLGGSAKVACTEKGGWTPLRGDTSKTWWKCGDGGGCDGEYIMQDGRPACRKVTCPKGSTLQDSGMCLTNPQPDCRPNYDLTHTSTGMKCEAVLEDPVQHKCEPGWTLKDNHCVIKPQISF